ncbi:Cathepsin 8 [Eumeta japonica]|uniref:Cathepsin 8 n=1 Tax=Eumeta variegata TaxID=151549 RepID=A0A4C1URK7_EUMVA|nr:Cathepsin 8 [Eumeta japonica]
MNTLRFLNETQRFGDFLKYYDVEDCADDFDNSSYVKRHVYGQFIIDPDLPAKHWEEYKSIFNKSYRTRLHENFALSAWKKNMKLVAEHNMQYLQGKQSYALHLNNFADWVSS